MGQRQPLFILFSSFLSTKQKNSAASRIRTRIVGVDGKDADSYTTAMAQKHSRNLGQITECQ